LSTLRHKRRIKLVIAVVLTAVVMRNHRQIRWTVAHVMAQPLSINSEFVTFPLDEPSGIARHTKRGTLIAVSDQGQLIEFDEHFHVSRWLRFAADLESVAVHPVTGTLFVACENSNTIIEYDLDSDTIIRRLHIDFVSCPEFSSGLTRNQGVEGVTIVVSSAGESSLFVAVEASPARVVRLDANISACATKTAQEASASGTTVEQLVQVSEVYDVGLTRISDIAFEEQSGLLMIVSAGERVLKFADLRGHTSPNFRLPGAKPEGICLLVNGDALVVDDSGGAWRLLSARAFVQSIADKWPWPQTCTAKGLP